MPQFAYEARNDKGDLTAGTLAADTVEKAGRLLSERRLFVVRISKDRSSEIDLTGVRGRATRAEVAWQLTQMAVMLETGMRLSDILDIISRQASKPRLRSLVEQVRNTVQGGKPLSEAMRKFPRSFPASVTALIRASEMSGTLTSVMRQCSGYLVNEMQCIRKIRSALMYPAFMLLACIGVTVFLLTVILPKFAAIYASRNALLPAPTRMLMAASDGFTSHWFLWVAGTVAAGAGFVLWMGTERGRRHRDYVCVHLPPFSPIFNSLYQARTCRTMGVLLNAGVLMVDALQIVREIVPNFYYQSIWQDVESNIERGERLAGPLLESKLIPEHLSQMIDNGDKAGKLGTVFVQLADFVEEDYHRAVKTMMQFIEPCMILVMGTLIGFVSIALLLPLFQASKIFLR